VSESFFFCGVLLCCMSTAAAAGSASPAVGTAGKEKETEAAPTIMAASDSEGVLDAITSPRNGKGRFVDDEEDEEISYTAVLEKGVAKPHLHITRHRKRTVVDDGLLSADTLTGTNNSSPPSPFSDGPSAFVPSPGSASPPGAQAVPIPRSSTPNAASSVPSSTSTTPSISPVGSRIRLLSPGASSDVDSKVDLPPGSLSPTLESVVAHLDPLKKKCAARLIKPSFTRSRAVQTLMNASLIDDKTRKPNVTEACEHAFWLLRWNSSGDYLAGAGHDGSIHVWKRAASNEGCLLLPTPVAVIHAHKDDVITCDWSKDDILATGSMDGTVVLCQPAKSSEVLLSMKHGDVVNCIRWCVSSGSDSEQRTMITGSIDHILRMWKIDLKKRSSTVLRAINLDTFITALTLNPTGDQAIVGTFDSKCIFVDLAEFTMAAQFSISGVRSARIRDGKRAVTGFSVRKSAPELLVTSNDGRIRLYNLADFRLVRKYKGFECSKLQQIYASFNKDGSYIICPSEDRAVCFWPTGSVTATSAAEGHSVDAEVFRCSTRSVSAAVFVPRRDCEATDFHDPRFFVAADIRGAVTVFENPDMSLLPP